MHINYDIKDTEYRRQLLALTPLGSTHEQVKAFVWDEWGFEKRNRSLGLKESLGLTTHYLPFDFRRSLREQPPHVDVADPTNPFPIRKGRQYLNTAFYHRPVFWKNTICIIVFYVFDDQHRLIDLFAHADASGPPAW